MFKCSHNKFSDFSIGEFMKIFMGFDAKKHRQDKRENRGEKERKKFDLDVNGLPTGVDWRDEGYVNPVQSQGQCGCCYAFSACAAIEGQYFKKHGKLIKLSGRKLIFSLSAPFSSN